MHNLSLIHQFFLGLLSASPLRQERKYALPSFPVASLISFSVADRLQSRHLVLPLLGLCHTLGGQPGPPSATSFQFHSHQGPIYNTVDPNRERPTDSSSLPAPKDLHSPSHARLFFGLEAKIQDIRRRSLRLVPSLGTGPRKSPFSLPLQHG